MPNQTRISLEDVLSNVAVEESSGIVRLVIASEHGSIRLEFTPMEAVDLGEELAEVGAHILREEAS